MKTITCTCPFCGKVYSINVSAKEYEDGIERYQRGELLQNAFPTFTPSQREAIHTGICDECWDSM